MTTDLTRVKYSALPPLGGPAQASDGVMVYRNGLKRAPASAVLRFDDFPVDKYGTITFGTSVSAADAQINCATINAAISAAASAGGGRVLLPAGVIRVKDSFPGYTPQTMINGTGWPYDGPIHHLHIPASNITIVGKGMGATKLVSGQPSCMFTAHHFGTLQNIVLTGFSCVNDMGIQTQYSTMGIYWCGRLTVHEVEWQDWSMCCYGVGASDGCAFTHGRYLWTRGRESIGYTGHSNNFAHPNVGIMWPGNHPTVSDNYFNGQMIPGYLSSGTEPETLPLDWVPTTGELRTWPDICRQSTDGLIIQFNNGGVIANNRIYSNGIEGILVDYNADLTDPTVPVSITGNTIDSLHWRGKLSINYPSYGIVVNHRSCVSVVGNSLKACDIGLTLKDCRGNVSSNSLLGVLHGAWIMSCYDMAVTGNTVDCKVMEPADVLAQYNCERGLFVGTPGSMLIQGNVLTGPTAGWKVGEVTVSRPYTQGDLRVYLDTVEGLIYGIPLERDGSWLAQDYVEGVSLGWAFPVQMLGIDPVLGPWVEMPNTDWSSRTPSMAAGTVLSQFNDGPGRVSGIIVTKPTDAQVRVVGNTIRGFIYGVSVDQPEGRAVDMMFNDIVAGHVRKIGNINEIDISGQVPFDSPLLRSHGRQLNVVDHTTNGAITADTDVARWAGPHVYGAPTLTRPYTTGDWRVYVSNTYGVPSGGWVSFGYVAGVSVGWAMPIGTVGTDPTYGPYVETISDDWRLAAPNAASGSVAGLFAGDFSPAFLQLPPLDGDKWRITVANDWLNDLLILRSTAVGTIDGQTSSIVAAGQAVTLQSLGNGKAVVVGRSFEAPSVRNYTDTAVLSHTVKVARWNGGVGGALILAPMAQVPWECTIINEAATDLTIIRNGTTGLIDGASTLTLSGGQFVVLRSLGNDRVVRVGGSQDRLWKVQTFTETTNPMPVIDVAVWNGASGGILVVPALSLTWRIVFINKAATDLTIMRNGSTGAVAGGTTYNLVAGQTVTLQCLGDNSAVIIP